ncbi:MAG: hypothetical protein VR64_21365 [Desulfatitalea sp. BRH_c12]|nr:MAG: hypothetical protein VR64_21365 [Desulfatitalea sp. BRH_c12]
MRDLYVVHDDSKTIKCVFHTMVVRNAAIAAKFPGGLKAFVEKHRPRCNNGLSVMCSMGFNDLEPLVQDLQAYGFDRGDAVHFDAASYLIGAGATGDYHDIEFGIPWLKGECTKDGVFVRHVESKSAPAPSSDTAGLVLKLYHHERHDIFRRLKRKKWAWQFLAGGEVTGSMISSWYQTFNIGHTADKRFWALQDQQMFRRIVTIAEVDRFDPKDLSTIAVRLIQEYDEWYLDQMTQFGEIPLQSRKRK